MKAEKRLLLGMVWALSMLLIGLIALLVSAYRGSFTVQARAIEQEATGEPALALPSSTPTSQPASQLTPPPAPTETALSDPTVVEAPLEIEFPEAQATVDPAWHPPLYPIPWAPGPHDHFYLIRPIAVDQVNWPLEDYRYGGILQGVGTVHAGVDIDAAPGTDVLAAGDGRVIWVGYGLFMGDTSVKDPYGMAVAIRHDYGYQGERLYTIYAHMSKILVENGQQVNAGDPIGRVGNTGNTTGPHLHFEVRLGENLFEDTRNPELWVAPPQGWGVLVGRIMGTAGQLIEAQLVTVRSVTDGVTYWAKSYGPAVPNSDSYYQENLVLGDLPEGDYTVRTNYLSRWEETSIHITGGQVTYVTLQGRDGWIDNPPPGASSDSFTPPTP